MQRPAAEELKRTLLLFPPAAVVLALCCCSNTHSTAVTKKVGCTEATASQVTQTSE
jgi:hypothetical protein